MTSTPDKLKQEPPQADVQMHSDDDTGQEQGNDSGLSNQTDCSQPSQKDTNQVTQNDETQPGQKDTNHVGQNNGEQPGQINVNQATQSNETRPGQKNTNDVGQINGNQSTNENPFLSGFFKRKVDKDNSANNARAFSPVVEDPNPKKAKTDHSFSFNPSAKAKTAPFSPRAQTTTRTSPFPEDDGVGDPDLEKDLVGSQVCPENMTTLGLVKEGKRPRYLNEYRIDGRSILRIETLKDGKFNENAAEVLAVTGGKYQAQHADKKWRDVDYVLGVAAFGSELNYEDFLCKLDPENPSKFKWMQTILIGIRWVDQTVTFVNRQWWRNNYEARDLSAKQTYLDRKEDGYRYWYKTRDDPEWRTRVNHKAFEDYRLFKWAFFYEKRYYQAMNPGQRFEIRDRTKSPSPIDDEVAKFRAMTVEESPRSKIYQSVETSLPDDDEGFDSDSRHSTQSRYKSSSRPKAHHDASLRVDPNGSLRPRDKHRFSTMRRFQQPLGTTPRSMVVAH
jgi:penicillin-binding protein 1A